MAPIADATGNLSIAELTFIRIAWLCDILLRGNNLMLLSVGQYTMAMRLAVLQVALVNTIAQVDSTFGVDRFGGSGTTATSSGTLLNHSYFDS